MRSSQQKTRPGFVLIVTLLMIAVLAGIIFEIYYEARMALHISNNRLAGTQARLRAQGGVAFARGGLHLAGGKCANGVHIDGLADATPGAHIDARFSLIRHGLQFLTV